MPWLAAAAVAAPVIGGMMGGMAASKDRKQQKKMMKAALAELERLGLPPDLSGPLLLKEFQSAGIYTPEMEEDLSSEVEESVTAQIKEDPGLRQAQMQALNSLQQRAKVGLSAEDRAALNQVRSESQRDANANREAIRQRMLSQGMGGSGTELMMLLQGDQGAADQAAAGSDALMSQAQSRALDALGQSGRMAGDVRAQDFGVEETKARALDERNRFLNENSIARQRQNVSTRNEAQRLNLAEQQQIAKANTQLANAEQLRQRNEQGAFFDRKASLAGQKASAKVGQAAQYGQQADRTAQQYAGIGSAIGTGIGGYAQMQNTNNQVGLDRQARYSQTGLSPDAAGGTTGYSRDYLSDEMLKENVDYTDDEVQAWLDSLSLKVNGKKRK